MRSVRVPVPPPGTAGYIDVLPLAMLDVNTPHDGYHVVRGPKGGRYHARYRLNANQSSVLLDYAQFPDFNDRNGIELGVMEIVFDGALHGSVKVVRWDGVDVTPSIADVRIVETSGDESPGVNIAREQAKFAQQMLRPGQSLFRTRLDEAYAAQCVISRCPVPHALEAAHIRDFADDPSNNAPTNGLLLRGDLHALFDAGELAAHPDTRIVYFSNEARVWAEYAGWHDKRRLLNPQPGHEAATPAREALDHRWCQFVRRFGDPA